MRSRTAALVTLQSQKWTRRCALIGTYVGVCFPRSNTSVISIFVDRLSAWLNTCGKKKRWRDCLFQRPNQRNNPPYLVEQSLRLPLSRQRQCLLDKGIRWFRLVPTIFCQIFVCLYHVCMKVSFVPVKTSSASFDSNK